MHFKVSSAICFSLDQSKILSSGSGLCDGEENIAGKVDIAEFQHFLVMFFS